MLLLRPRLMGDSAVRLSELLRELARLPLYSLLLASRAADAVDRRVDEFDRMDEVDDDCCSERADGLLLTTRL